MHNSQKGSPCSVVRVLCCEQARQVKCRVVVVAVVVVRLSEVCRADVGKLGQIEVIYTCKRRWRVGVCVCVWMDRVRQAQG